LKHINFTGTQGFLCLHGGPCNRNIHVVKISVCVHACVCVWTCIF